MPVDPINKAILENQKHLISLQKENKELKEKAYNFDTMNIGEDITQLFEE